MADVSVYSAYVDVQPKQQLHGIIEKDYQTMTTIIMSVVVHQFVVHCSRGRLMWTLSRLFCLSAIEMLFESICFRTDLYRISANAEILAYKHSLSIVRPSFILFSSRMYTHNNKNYGLISSYAKIQPIQVWVKISCRFFISHPIIHRALLTGEASRLPSTVLLTSNRIQELQLMY